MILHRLRLFPFAAFLAVGALTGVHAEDYAMTTFAGAALQAGSTDGTPGLFNNPYAIAIDAQKNLYVSDTTNHTIRKITPGRVVSTLAGSPGLTGSTNGTGSAARFNFPVGLAADAAGNVYVADLRNSVIRKITPAGVVTTLAGTPGQFGTADGTGASARFFFPCGVAVDAAGNVYVADTGNHLIRRVTPEGVVTTLAGSGAAGTSDGTGSAARFSSPWGIAVDRGNSLIVADSANHTIRRVTFTGTVTTVAGTAGTTGGQDGTGASARFNLPRGLSVDGSGNIYVADYGNSVVRHITPAGAVSTLAGSAGIVGAVDSVGSAARFFDPTDIVADGTTIYVADTSNNTVRRGVPASQAPLPVLTIEPIDQDVTVGQSITFRVAATGTSLTYQWLRNGAPISEATGSTYTIASPQVGDGAAYSVRVTGAGGLTRTSTAGNLTVTPVGSPIAITARPIGQHVNVGQSVNFSVTASGPALSYQWLRNGAAISGATTPSYTIASAQLGDAGDYAVRITSGANAETATAKLRVTTAGGAGISISANPVGQTVAVGQPVSFSITASASAPIAYQWLKNDSAIPGATSTTYSIGAVTAADAGSYTVRITAGGETQFSAAAVLTVTGGDPGPGPGPGTFSRLVNLSILSDIASAGDAFTMGYVVGPGGATGTKPILIRAVGPTLGAAPFNVPGTVADPKIELFAGATKTSENDNWGGSAALSTAFTGVGAFPYVAAASLDAAAIASIGTGDNSVRVSANGNGTGTVLAELYDTIPSGSMTPTSPRLVNVSVLKHLGTSLTVGFVIDGNTTKRVLVRAVGPTLGTLFGVGGVVADPQMTLFSGQTSIGANDNWGGGPELTAAFTQVGAFALPAASRDAALIATLEPGPYTVRVSGVGGTGVALVEVYEVP